MTRVEGENTRLRHYCLKSILIVMNLLTRKVHIKKRFKGKQTENNAARITLCLTQKSTNTGF